MFLFFCRFHVSKKQEDSRGIQNCGFVSWPTFEFMQFLKLQKFSFGRQIKKPPQKPRWEIDNTMAGKASETAFSFKYQCHIITNKCAETFAGLFLKMILLLSLQIHLFNLWCNSIRKAPVPWTYHPLTHYFNHLLPFSGVATAGHSFSICADL